MVLHCLWEVKFLPHAIGTIDFAQLHSTNDQAWNHLTGSLDNSILRDVHIQSPHPTKFLNLLHRNEALDGEGTEGTVMTSC